MVKWGVIGCGGIAKRRMLPASSEMKKSAFVAVMDVDKSVTDEAAASFGCRAYYDEASLLRDPEVQAVYVATPVYLHRDQVIRAAAAGKHVLVEKPLALNLRQGEEMVEACKEAGVHLVEGYMMKYHALNSAARDIVARGEIGPVTFARAQLSCWYPEIPGAWRQDPKKGGGGALMDLATHCYGLLEYITGSKISEVFAYTNTQTFKYPVDDSSTTLLRFENGAHGVVDAFFNVPDSAGQDRLEIYGNKGSLQAEGTIGQMPNGKLAAYLSDDSKDYDSQQSKESLQVTVREITAEPVNMYAAEVDYISDCIESGVCPSINTGEDGLHVLRVAIGAYESSRTGRSIKL